MMQPRSPTAREGARPLVLVVEDVDATRNGLVELLRTLGYDACTARDGAEGIAALRAEPQIRAVVLDLRMPGTNGYWFREQQLKDPQLARVPVIVFTGAGPQDIPDSLNFSEVLFKPLSVDRLIEAISRCCGT